MGTNLNSQLLEALQAQSNDTSNPLHQALLSRNTLETQSGYLPSTQELINQLESTNPTLGLVAKYLIARQESLDGTAAEDEIGLDEDIQEIDDPHLAIDRYERLVQIVLRLEQHVRKLRTERDELREKNDTLAAALGACYLCWGDDPSCPNCYGMGSAGSITPDQKLFSQIIKPAISKIRAQKGNNQSNSIESSRPSQEMISRKEMKDE